MRVLGLDPAARDPGYGILDTEGGIPRAAFGGIRVPRA